MIYLTREQRKALKQVYDRVPLGISYKEFRKSVEPLWDKSGCIIVKWCNMWLGIETDGYTHS